MINIIKQWYDNRLLFWGGILLVWILTAFCFFSSIYPLKTAQYLIFGGITISGITCICSLLLQLNRGVNSRTRIAFSLYRFLLFFGSLFLWGVLVGFGGIFLCNIYSPSGVEAIITFAFLGSFLLLCSSAVWKTVMALNNIVSEYRRYREIETEKGVDSSAFEKQTQKTAGYNLLLIGIGLLFFLLYTFIMLSQIDYVSGSFLEAATRASAIDILLFIALRSALFIYFVCLTTCGLWDYWYGQFQKEIAKSDMAPLTSVESAAVAEQDDCGNNPQEDRNSHQLTVGNEKTQTALPLRFPIFYWFIAGVMNIIILPVMGMIIIPRVFFLYDRYMIFSFLVVLALCYKIFRFTRENQTGSNLFSLFWGICYLVAVIAGFLFLGGILGLVGYMWNNITLTPSWIISVCFISFFPIAPVFVLYSIFNKMRAKRFPKKEVKPHGFLSWYLAWLTAVCLLFTMLYMFSVFQPGFYGSSIRMNGDPHAGMASFWALAGSALFYHAVALVAMLSLRIQRLTDTPHKTAMFMAAISALFILGFGF